MKRLIQLNLLLLLISSATAQNVQDFRNLEKTLRVYDWKDLTQQHQLDGGELNCFFQTEILSYFLSDLFQQKKGTLTSH